MPQDQRQVDTTVVKNRRVFRPPREPIQCFAKITRWDKTKNQGFIYVDDGKVLLLKHRLFKSSEITEPTLLGKWVKFDDSDVVAGRDGPNLRILKKAVLITDAQEIAHLEIEASHQ